MSHSTMFVWPSWRNCAVGSRAELGDQIALVVRGGSAEFVGVVLEPLDALLVDNIEEED